MARSLERVNGRLGDRRTRWEVVDIPAVARVACAVEFRRVRADLCIVI